MSKPCVFLINAGNDSERNVANYAIFPPLNVLSLGSAVKHEFKDLSVRVYDGQACKARTINKMIRRRVQKGDIVGISMLSGSFGNALSHAKAAKKKNAVTILGNDHPAVYGHNILRDHSNVVDFICTADIGELVFCHFLHNYLEGRKMNGIPQFMYMEKNGEVIVSGGDELPKDSENHEDRYVLDNIPIINWDLIRRNLWRYSIKYDRVYSRLLHATGHSHLPMAVTINRARGCRRYGKPCIYCGIRNLKPRFSSPEFFWREVSMAKEKVKAEIFYEACDNLTGKQATSWLRELVERRPEELTDVKFFVYAEALNVTKELVRLYSQLGVFMVNMGLDSGDNETLRILKSGWGDSVQHNRDAVDLLNGEKINVYASFVFGAPGENAKSLQNTVKFTEDLLEHRRLAAIELDVLYPLFNAKAGEWLRKPEYAEKEASERGFKIMNPKKLEEMPKKWNTHNDPDPEKISRDWIEIFCDVTYEEIQNAIRRIEKVADRHRVPYGKAW